MKYLAILLAALSLSVCSTTRTVKEEPFSVNHRSPKIALGEIQAQLERFFSMGGLKESNIVVDYYPIEDAVCLQYRNDLTTYYQFWSKEGREVFLNALAKYKEDFAERKLNSKGNNKTRMAYGSVQGFLFWQLHRFSIRASGNPEIRIGYDFQNFDASIAAFLTLTQREVEFRSEATGNEYHVAPNIMIYFTMSQAEALASLFDQEVLESLRSEQKSTAVELDVYDAFEEGN